MILYEQVLSTVQKVLNDWLLNKFKQRNYMAITAHIIDFSLKLIFLNCGSSSGLYTGINIAHKLSKIIQKYEFKKSKIYYILQL